jgi:hypothetical protein
MNTPLRIGLCALAPLALILAPSPSLAKFKVIQAKGAAYVPVAGPVACGLGMCKTSLDPAQVVTLSGLGYVIPAANLLFDNLFQRPAYTINPLGPSQNIDFKITNYSAINNGAIGGGQLVVDFTPQQGAVLPANLHWIQIVTDNYNITGVNGANLAAPKGPGKFENVVDATGSATPYYDVAAAAGGFGAKFNATPPHFEDFSSRLEPTAAFPTIVWNANLFLVSDNGANFVTVYDAVDWGWVSQYSANGKFGAIPEPDVWAMMLLGFGLTGAMARSRRRRASA